MTTWLKPSGMKIDINDRKETVEYAKSLGWSKFVPEKKVRVVKAKRKKAKK